MDNSLQCPVDFIPVNENKVRLTAFFVMVLGIGFLATGLWIIIAFLVADFFLRVNNWGKYSLLALVSDAAIRRFRIKNKPTDRAPKRFAAGVGLVFAIGILVVTLLNLDITTIIITCVLLLFAFLESVIGFCAGCYVYSYLQKVSNILKNRE